jgi:hypothetical protein
MAHLKSAYEWQERPMAKPVIAFSGPSPRCAPSAPDHGSPSGEIMGMLIGCGMGEFMGGLSEAYEVAKAGLEVAPAPRPAPAPCPRYSPPVPRPRGYH